MEKFNKPKHCGKSRHIKDLSKTKISDDILDAKDYGYNKQIKNETNKKNTYICR
jgi:hypothetical protein